MALFVFHNDLRLIDNTALDLAMANEEAIYPVFIFTPSQIDKNKYKSEFSVKFMCESLVELDSELRKKGSKLHIFHGPTDKVVKSLVKTWKIKTVYSNCSYSPFAINRDTKISKIPNIQFLLCEDMLLLPIGMTSKNPNQLDPDNLITLLNERSTKVYKKYTPYYNSARKINVDKPTKSTIRKLKKSNKSMDIKSIKKYYSTNEDKDNHLPGGRLAGLKLLRGFNKSNYGQIRNDLSKSTSYLSAYIKFGCVSIREVYKACKSNSEFVKQLYWRDFYYNILWKYPYVVEGPNRNLQEKYKKIKWLNKPDSLFKKWCHGETGYPVVDAGMRQLNESGYMHNRARLITAGFLVKVLGWNWEDGEHYFATKLRDYDISANNGNWQFVAGTGVDIQPYWRGFNPWLQSAKFDKKATYIKKWVPELKDVPPAHIHKWYKYCDQYDGYFEPMIDYDEYSKKTKKMYTKYIFKK